jgi:methionyl-tRNA synthetase
LPEKILVTSALPYANGPIHLGHLAGAYLPADIYVRYYRLKGVDIIFICGSDEHGVPIMLKARNQGVSPQKIVDYYHELNKKSFEAFGMSFDYYGRTSSKIHHETSQDFFRRLDEKNHFILKSEKQLYDPEAGIFLADRFVRGTCPSCQYEDAYGDQCEKCGSSLSPMDLINPRSAITNAKPVLKETTHWYLPLSEVQQRLKDWINSHPEWKSNVLGQVKSWLNEGLKDRAVTRDLPWGVNVPEDVAKKHGTDATGKVLYVWFDAPIGYISATREWAEQKNDSDLWKKYWQDKNTKLIHFIGKDNIVFHCLIFPAMLMEHDDFVIPNNVPANEFLNLEGSKLSTSRNYAVWLDDYMKKFHPDSLRYVLASNMPEARDTDFSWKDFQARHNNELADILGNFINRTVTFIHKYFDGVLPEASELDTLDEELISRLKDAPERLGHLIETFQFRVYIKELMDLTRFANKYFNDKEPWVTRKTNLASCATTLHYCLQTVYAFGVLFEPVIPFSAKTIRKLLNIIDAPDWSSAGKLILEAGQNIAKPEIIFQKLEDDIIQLEIDKLSKVESDSSVDEQADTIENDLISIDEFKNIELRVAEIIEAECIKKKDRLLKLNISIGSEKRQIVAGIAQHYTPEALIGKKIIVVANLQPAKIGGIESNGMLLAAKKDKKLTLLTILEDIPSGAHVD